MDQFFSQSFRVPGTGAEYSYLFALYLIVGWTTILIHAHRNFERPTYTIQRNEPASLMIPRFLSSDNLYFRGFSIYVGGMSIIYVLCSFLGPNIVSSQDKRPVVDPDHWPLLLALAIVGLAPSIPWFKEPELLLRRFSQRVSFIPAYARDLAGQMARASFVYPVDPLIRFPVETHYRPTASNDPLVHLWLKLCVIAVRIRSMSDDGSALESGTPMDDSNRVLLQKEAQLFFSSMHEIEAKLVEKKLNDAGRAVVERDINNLLRRGYLFVACGLLAYRVNDIGDELQSMGFAATGVDTPALLPFCMVFTLLFLWLLISDNLIIPLISKYFNPEEQKILEFVQHQDFIERFKGIGLIVVDLGLSLFSAFIIYRKLDSTGNWRGRSILARRITAYFVVVICAYLAGGGFLLLYQCLNGLSFANFAYSSALSFYNSIPLGVAALLFALVQRRKATAWPVILGVGTMITVLVGASWGGAKVLCSMDISMYGPDPWPSIVHDITQGLAIGLAVAFLAEMMRSYQARSPGATSVASPPASASPPGLTPPPVPAHSV
jgi:hypothetical protein